MKYERINEMDNYSLVALFTRAWIEMEMKSLPPTSRKVALFTRAWIEIVEICSDDVKPSVALFTRAWIEIV